MKLHEKIIVGIVILASLTIIGVGGFFLYDVIPKDSLGAGFIDNRITLVGSSSNLVSLPTKSSFSAATTTDSGSAVLLRDGGSTIQQEIDTKGIRKVLLYIVAKQDTGTSTAFIIQQGSFNGTDFFNIASSTDNFVGTSSPPFMAKAVQFDAGLSTSSPGLVIPFTIDGYAKTRFIFSAEDIAADPTDGVQAWIVATLIEDIVR